MSRDDCNYLVRVVDVASEWGSNDVSILMNNLDDVRSHLIRFVLHYGRVRSVIHVQLKKLTW